MEKINEIWRPIIGYEGYYEVSNTGKVKSVDSMVKGRRGLRNRKGKELKTAKLKNSGYPYVILSKNGKRTLQYVHRLVAFAFPEICGEYFEGATVDHLDWNVNNNVAENLKWATRLDNLRRHHPPVFVPKMSRLRPFYVENIRAKKTDYFLSRTECAKYLGIKHKEQVSLYLKTGKPYKRTFLFQYLDESHPKYMELCQINSPTTEQIKYYGLN